MLQKHQREIIISYEEELVENHRISNTLLKKIYLLFSHF